MALVSKSCRRAKVAGLTTLCLMTLLVCTAASAAPPAWPSKKGELCWDANAGGEHSLVIAQVTNMGNAHYVFHGQAYRSDLVSPGPMQPFDGNAEIDATNPSDVRVTAMITKTEIRPVHNGNPRTLEIYSGQIDLDYDTLDGWAEGIIYICEDPQTPSETPTCKFITTGQISMTKVACP
ncbi:MAG: hypothetical protein WBG93_21500 [Thermoanaerobaculia bacterium]